MIKKVRYDYQPPRSARRQRPQRGTRRFLPAVILLVALTVGGIILFGPSGPDLQASITPVEVSAPKHEKIRIPQRDVFRSTIQSGETISSLLGGYFTPQEIHDLGKRSKKVFPLTRIIAGQPYQVSTLDGKFDTFAYEIDSEEQLVIRRQEDKILLERVPINYEVSRQIVRGRVESSLFEAVANTGESSELATALADIFAWDIDFLRDLRKGDSFSALVEKRYRDGKPAGYGRVLAAEFRNNGALFRAFYYKDGDRPASYYDEKGRSVRKAFLKAPLSFTRISSGFTFKRFHPITKTWKSHPAIDYAAPTGTPIKTVGDGTITRIGYTKGNGNFVEVRHSGGYRTIYLHMSRFGRGMKKGKRVAQGQIIGYVGATGLATGPHLCFRMKKNGRPVNPYKVKAPAAKPVSKKLISDFKRHSRGLTAQLEGREEIQVATLKEQAEPGLTQHN